MTVFLMGVAFGGIVATLSVVAAYSRLVRTLREAVPAKTLGYERCVSTRAGFDCSRQRGHAGDHVARRNHTLDVVKVWKGGV